jgi:hypothetical protein
MSAAGQHSARRYGPATESLCRARSRPADRGCCCRVSPDDGTVDAATDYVFTNVIALPTPPNYNAVTNPDIQLASITLPATTSGQAIHIFSMAAR